MSCSVAVVLVHLLSSGELHTEWADLQLLGQCPTEKVVACYRETSWVPYSESALGESDVVHVVCADNSKKEVYSGPAARNKRA